MPVIRYLLASGHKVTVAGNDWQRRYITETFTGIDTIHLDGYDVWYSKKASGFLPALFIQLPRLLKIIKNENNWLKDAVDKYGFDGIITDNRYGLYHASVPNVIITHQVVPQSGWGWMPDKILQIAHDERLARFDNCWIADIEGEPNLAGSLSHPAKKPANATYIGLLSQLQKTTTSEEHLLVLLSGPEPQRSILSEMLWKQLKNYTGKIVFVEGSNDVNRKEIPGHITYFNRLTADKLTPLLAAASMVICRSGYSSLMDLIALNKKAILIPTPGQAEQEYLGRHLHREGVFYCTQQKNLDINSVLAAVKGFPFRNLGLNNAHEQYKAVVNDWLEKI